MTTRYQEKHYGDVAGIIDSSTFGSHTDTISKHGIVTRFADLFAADNPRRCSGCGDHEPPGAVCEMPDEGHWFVGFDRKQFLAACGLESEG